MKRANARRSRDDTSGFASIEYVLAAAFTLLLFVVASNVIVDLYIRAAVREALDEGARAAVVAGRDANDCRRKAEQVLTTLVTRYHGSSFAVSCELDAGWVVARARVAVPGFAPMLIPTWHFELEARASRESTA